MLHAAPEWFSSALARRPERTRVVSRGSELELLTWGKIGQPGLVFVHGATAQADWWSFIAPYFADHFRVAAFSLPGMGRSGWREQYAFEDFPRDAEAIVEAADLLQSGELPIFVAHSFGGSFSHYLAAHHPERLRALILVDSALRATSAASVQAHNAKAGVRRSANGGRHVYPSRAQAVARFRLIPPQPVENRYILEFLAEQALEPTLGGWSWCYDPQFWDKFVYGDTDPSTYGSTIPIAVAHLYGSISEFRAEPNSPAVLPAHAVELEIPEAHHHVLIDQPLALIAALRAVLSGWVGPSASHIRRTAA